MTLDQLQRFDQYPHRETFARITHWDISIPSNKHQIEGRITGGSANLDGNSAVRRSCSLTLACPSDFITDDIWLNYNTSLTNRFRLEVGLTNFNLLDENFETINILENGIIDNTILDLRKLETILEGTTLILSDVDGDLDGHPNVTYDQDRQIFWFDLGEYVCSSYSVSQSTNSLTINISGKDKMCLLNGEIGGKIESTVDFGTFDQVAEDNTIINTKIPVDEIIREAVHHYGQIPYEDIEIEDIPFHGRILKEYRYDKPLYLFRNPIGEQFMYNLGTFNGEQEVQLEDETMAALQSLSNDYFDKTIPELESATHSVYLNGVEYKLHRIDFGETAGYEQTPLVYPGELIAKPGETITTSVLDKIKNMLGDYEYFFKTNGKFRFQKRATAYAYQDNPSEAEEELYTFPEGKIMFTAFNTTPQISNVRNDFSIWGSRKGVGGADIAIHGRFAIQEKPKTYEAFVIEDEEKENFKTKYGVELTSQGGHSVKDTDGGGWREVLYQMAKDYYAYSRIPRYVADNEDVITKYQPYFTDMLGFWRQIYCPVDNENEKVTGIKYDSEGWNVNVNQAPHLLNFCIEFFGLDYPEYSKYSIDKIGYRPDVSNDSSVGAIQYPAIPQIIFYDGDNAPANEENVALFKVPGLIKDMFSTSTQKRSVYDAAATLKLNKIECLENVSITSIPVFHLEPNTRVKIEGDKYLITRLTMPLTYNGTMSITASKIIETKPMEELIGASTGGK